MFLGQIALRCFREAGLAHREVEPSEAFLVENETASGLQVPAGCLLLSFSLYAV